MQRVETRYDRNEGIWHVVVEQAEELVWADAVEQASAIRRGHVSASDLLEVYLDRIERHDPTLRSYVTVDVEGARERAREADDALRKNDSGQSCRRSTA